MDKIITIVLLTLASKINDGNASCNFKPNKSDIKGSCEFTVTCQGNPPPLLTSNIIEYDCVKKSSQYMFTLKANAINDTSVLSVLKDNNMLPNIEKIQITNSDIDKVSQLIDMPNVKEIVLTGNHFKVFDINKIILNSVTVINFSNNEISTLNGTYSQRFENVSTINLSYNSITYIPHRYFECFSNLKILNLERNNITEIDVLAFKGITKLEELHLSYNNLQKIDEVYFVLAELKHLFLAHNNIHFVSKRSLRALSKLESLDLSSNKIEALEENTFETLSELKTLNLFDNEITYIPKTLLSKNKNLESLILNRNKITLIGKDTFQGCQVKELDLSENNITHLDIEFALVNPNLETIILKNNTISDVTFSAFKKLMKLYTLDLSNNFLTELHFNSSDLVQLKQLDASYNNIINIDDNFFKNLSSLSILDLSHNKLDKFDFEKYDLKHITKLDLKYNPFKTVIEKEELISLKKVTDMDISHTNLQEFKEKAFYGMEKLITLNCSKTGLIKIDINAFEGANSIEKLDLSGNSLDKFDVTGMNSLTDLNLENNQITSIHDMFVNRTNLKYINLAHNKLEKIEPDYLNATKNLNHIDLSANTNLKINSKTFDGMTLKTVVLNQIKRISFEKDENTQIEELYLSDCNIQDIESVHINKVKKLAVLDLSLNKIEFILPTYFESLKELTSLNLGKNKIEYIAPNSFAGFDKLITLDLNNNELKFIGNKTLLGTEVLETINLSSNKINNLEINFLPKNKKHVKIFLDDNKLNSINVSDFLNMKVKEIRIGGNNIACKDIQNIIKYNTADFKVTASKLVNEKSNVEGISCIEEENKEVIVKHILPELASFQTLIEKYKKLESPSEIRAEKEKMIQKIEAVLNSFAETKLLLNKTDIEELDDKINNLGEKIQNVTVKSNQSDLYQNLLNITQQMQYDLHEKLTNVTDKPPQQRAEISKPLLLATAICSGSIFLLIIVKFSYSCLKSRSNK